MLILAADGLFAGRLVLGINVNLWWGLVMLLFGGVDARLRRAREERDVRRTAHSLRPASIALTIRVASVLVMQI